MSHILKHSTSDWEALGLVAKQLTTLILLWPQLNSVIPLCSLQRKTLLVEPEAMAVHTDTL